MTQQNQIQPTTDVIRSLEQQLIDTQHELAILINDYHLDTPCCELSDLSNGWYHDDRCYNADIPF